MAGPAAPEAPPRPPLLTAARAEAIAAAAKVQVSTGHRAVPPLRPGSAGAPPPGPEKKIPPPAAALPSTSGGLPGPAPGPAAAKQLARTYDRVDRLSGTQGLGGKNRPSSKLLSVQQKRAILIATGAPLPDSVRPRTAAQVRHAAASTRAANTQTAEAAAAHPEPVPRPGTAPPRRTLPQSAAERPAAPTSGPAGGSALGAGGSPAGAMARETDLEADVRRERVRAVERSVRGALHAARPYYDTERRVLLARLTAADTNLDGALSADELTAALRRWGLSVDAADAFGIFREHVDLLTDDGRLKYAAYAERLLAPHAHAARHGVCKRYPVTNADFEKKIVYPKCRTGVFAPPEWAPDMADRSAGPVDAAIRLQFAYGLGRGAAAALHCSAQGQVVYYLAGLGVVMDLSTRTQRFFDGHTNDITCCGLCPYPFLARLAPAGGAPEAADYSAICADARVYPAGTLVVTGQLKQVEDADTPEKEAPFVCIWDARDCTQVARIDHMPEDRGIAAAAFSPHGRWLTTVAMDNAHTVYVWDWRLAELLRRKGRTGLWATREQGGAKLGEGKGYQDAPPAVHGIAWDAYSSTPSFVTYGTLHVKRFWLRDGSWTGTLLSYGKLPRATACSAVFLPPPKGKEALLAVGTPAGAIYLFEGNTGLRAVAGAHPPPRPPPRGAAVDFDVGLRCLQLTPDGRRLLSGGDDGCVRVWEIVDGDLAPVAGPTANLLAVLPNPFPDEDNVVGVRSIDFLPYAPDGRAAAWAQPGGEGAFQLVTLVATSGGDLWAVEPGRRPYLLLSGHTGAVEGLCWHPRQPDLFVTGCDSGRLQVWSAVSRMMLRVCRMPHALKCVDVSPVPLGRGAAPAPAAPGALVPGAAAPAAAPKGPLTHHIASGGGNGRIVVFDEITLQPLFQDTPPSAPGHALCDVRYSPDGTLLAAGGHDRGVHIYATVGGHPNDSGYRRLYRLEGHSATVRQLDWSIDACTLQSACSGYELIYWRPREGRRLAESQRDTHWATWTSTLGFPVMGIWPRDSDGTDVNSCHRSASGRHIVTADDYGTVTLLNYPCVVEGAPGVGIRGHSAFVERVRFSPDDARVLSAGGGDRSLLQMETHNVVPRPPGAPPAPVDWCAVPGCGWCAKPPPVPPPVPVWGALDASGKSYGFTTSPVAVTAPPEDA